MPEQNEVNAAQRMAKSMLWSTLLNGKATGQIPVI